MPELLFIVICNILKVERRSSPACAHSGNFLGPVAVPKTIVFIHVYLYRAAALRLDVFSGIFATHFMLKNMLKMARETWAGGGDAMQVDATAKAKP